MSRPKEFGGLGYLDVRAVNICLLVKWIDKLEHDDPSLCCSLLKKKYLGDKSIFQRWKHFSEVAMIKTWLPLLKEKLKPTADEMLELLVAGPH